MHLSVIIPAYNEEKRLPKTLANIDGYLSRQSYDYEILVVDNGSTDKTAEIDRVFSSQFLGLKLVEGKFGRGKGYAVKMGMIAAQGDYRLFADADNSTSIDQVEKMWPEFEKGFDVVIGSRDVKGAVLDPPQPCLRRDIFPKSRVEHFAFDPEILLIAKKFGYKIKEIPVRWKNDLASKVKISSMV